MLSTGAAVTLGNTRTASARAGEGRRKRFLLCDAPLHVLLYRAVISPPQTNRILTFLFSNFQVHICFCGSAIFQETTDWLRAQLTHSRQPLRLTCNFQYLIEWLLLREEVFVTACSIAIEARCRKNKLKAEEERPTEAIIP